LVATLAIFAPSFLLLPAGIALWSVLRGWTRAPAILMGLNAAVVGLLAAVFVDPIGIALVHAPLAAVIALLALVALGRFALPVWLVVLGSAAAGGLVRVASSH
jgi:chromate transporter